MKLNGVKGDAITFSTLINGCLQSHRLDLAVEYLRDSIEEGVYLQPDNYQAILDEIQSPRGNAIPDRNFLV